MFDDIDVQKIFRKLSNIDFNIFGYKKNHF